MKNNDISFNINWDDIRSFRTKNSALKGCWLTAFYNDGCKQTGVKCMQDFYSAANIDFKSLNPTNDGKVRRLRPHEIRANKKTIDAISNYIHGQYHPTKYKGRQPGAIGMDLLNYLPYEDDEMPDNAIVVRIDDSIVWDSHIDYYEDKETEL